MTLQEIINSIESLPTEERDYLFEFLRKKKEESRGDNFWQGLQKFRSAIQSKGLRNYKLKVNIIHKLYDPNPTRTKTIYLR